MTEAKPVEIPVKASLNNRKWRSYPRKGAGNSGTPKKRAPQPPGAKDAAQAATAVNAKVLLLVDGRHRRFARAADAGQP